MSKVWITADSTCDLNEELFKEYQVEFVSMGITIGDKFYTDRVDVTPEDIYHAVEKLNLFPKTSAGLEEDYRNLFIKKTQNGDSVIHFSLSRDLSASHDNAKRAAEGMERVYVIDTRTLSSGVGLCAVIAGDMAKAGKTAEQIVEAMQDILPRLNVRFVVESLKYLHKGGRVSGLKLLGANMLGIRISLKLEDGKMIPDKKFRGKMPMAIKEFTKYCAESFADADKEIAFITLSDVPEADIAEMEKTVKAAGFKRVYRTLAGCGIVPHCGRGAIGIIFLNGK